MDRSSDYTALAVSILFAAPPALRSWPLITLALALGCVVGWYRGKTVRIMRDPETQKLMQQTSPVAMLILVALLFIRQGLRVEALAMGMDVNLVTYLLVVFAVGLLGAGAAERYIRAKRLDPDL